MATALQVLTKIDFPALVSTVATIVGLVETIFSGKKGIGPKKRERAIKAITRVLEVDGDISPAVLTVISFLVDVLGKNAGKVEVTEDILQIWTAVQTFVEATDGLPLPLRQWIERATHLPWAVTSEFEIAIRPNQKRQSEALTPEFSP